MAIVDLLELVAVATGQMPRHLLQEQVTVHLQTVTVGNKTSRHLASSIPPLMANQVQAQIPTQGLHQSLAAQVTDSGEMASIFLVQQTLASSVSSLAFRTIPRSNTLASTSQTTMIFP